jgi:hypothetical protein
VLVGSFGVELWWLAQLAKRAAGTASPPAPADDVALGWS